MKKILNLSILKFSIIIISSSCQINNSRSGMQSPQNLEKDKNNSTKSVEDDNKQKNNLISDDKEQQKSILNSNINDNQQKPIIDPISDPTINPKKDKKSKVSKSSKLSDKPSPISDDNFTKIELQPKEFDDKLNNIKEPELNYNQDILLNKNNLENKEEEIEEDKEDLNSAILSQKDHSEEDINKNFLNDSNKEKDNLLKVCFNYIFCYLCLCKCFCSKPKVIIDDNQSNYNKIKPAKKVNGYKDDDNEVR